ncbi:hypothetical protein M9H77_08278 [Catharanthus roseus]|uniref:Uncharacterized protein n=1 Tax=Catharanthus roseus TaxID=4058 RepID=A0ACC0BXL9_CATRO|nr:hypothetical protein M9H77_08278 [Catharanthus roseus]
MESRPTSQNQPSQVSEVSNTVSNVDENQFVNAISEQPINVLNEDENVAGIIDNMAGATEDPWLDDWEPNSWMTLIQQLQVQVHSCLLVENHSHKVSNESSKQPILKKRKRCYFCQEFGHNRQTCPTEKAKNYRQN